MPGQLRGGEGPYRVGPEHIPPQTSPNQCTIRTESALIHPRRAPEHESGGHYGASGYEQLLLNAHARNRQAS
jgi:hypothetical protein